MVMEPSCKISLCVFPSILFWIYCFDFYHVYVHIKAQLFIVKVNLQSMSFSVFCLPRLEVWSCSLTSISAWLTLSPSLLALRFAEGFVLGPGWVHNAKGPCCRLCVLWGNAGGVCLGWAGHRVTLPSLLGFHQRINGGQGLGETGRRSIGRRRRIENS